MVSCSVAVVVHDAVVAADIFAVVVDVVADIAAEISAFAELDHVVEVGVLVQCTVLSAAVLLSSRHWLLLGSVAVSYVVLLGLKLQVVRQRMQLQQR